MQVLKPGPGCVWADVHEVYVSCNFIDVIYDKIGIVCVVIRVYWFDRCPLQQCFPRYVRIRRVTCATNVLLYYGCNYLSFRRVEITNVLLRDVYVCRISCCMMHIQVLATMPTTYRSPHI